MTVNPALHPQIDDPNSGQPSEQERLLAGKYKSVEELERGYQNLFDEGRKLVDRLQSYEQGAASGPSREEQWLSDREDPQARMAQRNTQDPVDALSMAGVPVNELKSVIRQEVMREFQPIIQGANARQQISQDYPEFVQFEGELAQFLEANPQLKARYNRSYATDPEVALKWAFSEYTRTSGVRRSSASGEEQAAARLDAGLPGRIQPQRTPPGEFDMGTYNQLKEEAARTGNWEKVTAYKLRSSKQLPDSHFNGLVG